MAPHQDLRPSYSNPIHMASYAIFLLPTTEEVPPSQITFLLRCSNGRARARRFQRRRLSSKFKSLSPSTANCAPDGWRGLNQPASLPPSPSAPFSPPSFPFKLLLWGLGESARGGGGGGPARSPARSFDRSRRQGKKREGTSLKFISHRRRRRRRRRRRSPARPPNDAALAAADSANKKKAPVCRSVVRLGPQRNAAVRPSPSRPPISLPLDRPAQKRGTRLTHSPLRGGGGSNFWMEREREGDLLCRAMATALARRALLFK